jgi:hypothetical protein
MAQFRARIISGKGSEVSRLGHKTTGITTECNGWNVGVRVEAAHVDGQDVFTVYATGGSNGGKEERVATISDHTYAVKYAWEYYGPSKDPWTILPTKYRTRAEAEEAECNFRRNIREPHNASGLDTQITVVQEGGE